MKVERVEKEKDTYKYTYIKSLFSNEKSINELALEIERKVDDEIAGKIEAIAKKERLRRTSAVNDYISIKHEMQTNRPTKIFASLYSDGWYIEVIRLAGTKDIENIGYNYWTNATEEIVNIVIEILNKIYEEE